MSRKTEWDLACHGVLFGVLQAKHLSTPIVQGLCVCVAGEGGKGHGPLSTIPSWKTPQRRDSEPKLGRRQR